MDEMLSDSGDDIDELIKNHSETINSPSPEELGEALKSMAASCDEERETNPWLKRYHSLPAYKLDVVRDGSDDYFKALTKAIQAITSGDYGSVDYKGDKIYYNDTPHVCSISLADGQKGYSYHIGFECEALKIVFSEEYHSEEERKEFLNPDSKLFEKTLELLDSEIKELDKGTWSRNRKKLNIYDFKDYSPEGRRFKSIDWDQRYKEAAQTLSFLIEDAHKRAEEYQFSEADFDIFADVIRRMVFFADYGKRNSLAELDGLIRYEWKPKTKRNQYIWRCLFGFDTGGCPDSLLDKFALYYLIDDPKGWEAMAYLLPIVALAEMNQDYEPDNVKNEMLRVFDLIPNNEYRERIEKLIDEDRAKTGQGGFKYDQESI